MIFITEDKVNNTLERFEVDEAYIEDFKEILTTAPELTAYLNPENYSLLTIEELSLLEYLTCVIYHTVKSTLGNQPVIFLPSLEKHEESNWDVFNSSSGNKNFSKTLDTFFENYPQEDLLALVEDAIVADDDTPVTIVGAEIIFVTCKSIIDTLHDLN